MSERIKQLAENAAQLTDAKLDCIGEFHADYATVWNEEFAKLIILECIKEFGPTPYHSAYPDNFISGFAGLQLLESKINHVRKIFNLDV